MKITDESGDRKYFTVIPNYILNHSTLWDREVYIQMKRITGENGTCWASRKTLAKQCGMSIRRLDKSILYLIDHKWIEHIGKKEVLTRGGAQEINEYKIADLWKLNIEYYESLKGSAPETHPIAKGGARMTPKVVHGISKGGAPGAYKEELREEEPIKKNLLAFEQFWQAYPRKVAKELARKKLPIGNELGKILQALEAQKKSKQWQDSQFIPHPATWLGQRRWEDELPQINN